MPVKKKFTQEQLKELEVLAQVLTYDQLADYFRIGRTTFYEMLKREKEAGELYKKAKAKVIGSIAQSLLTKARSGDTTAQIFFLKTQAGWRETKEEVKQETPVVNIIMPKKDG
jgi:transposase